MASVYRRALRGLSAALRALVLSLLALGAAGAGAAAQAASAAASAAAPAEETAPAATEDLEALVATLKDDARREELVRDLELLLEARQLQAEAERPPPGDAAVNLLIGLAEDLWQALLAIDPRAVLLSGLYSIAVLLAALTLRWLLLRLLQRLNAWLLRLRADSSVETETADEAETEAETGAATATGAETGMVDGELPQLIRRLVNIIVGVAALAGIAEAWGANLSGLLATEIGSRLADTLVSTGFIVLVAAVLWNAAGPVVQRALTLGGRSDSDRTARRLDTLTPLLRSVLQTTITVMAALLVLSELGVNIGPLLAGAGILGLAVGFGAQTLVKDLISGVIILLEDGASVGDVVTVAGHTGAVEEMRIRTIRLRDLSGVVHLVPYGEVTTIENYTQDFSYFLTEIGVAYRENTDEVCAVIEAVGADLAEDPDWRADFLEPLQILGVHAFADSAVVIRARIKTVPGRQWALGREFNRRLKQRFDEQGIEIPFPHTTLYFGEPKTGKAPPLRLAQAADGED